MQAITSGFEAHKARISSRFTNEKKSFYIQFFLEKRKNWVAFIGLPE
jgi:hypothetical protein